MTPAERAARYRWAAVVGAVGSICIGALGLVAARSSSGEAQEAFEWWVGMGAFTLLAAVLLWFGCRSVRQRGDPAPWVTIAAVALAVAACFGVMSAVAGSTPAYLIAPAALLATNLWLLLRVRDLAAESVVG